MRRFLVLVLSALLASCTTPYDALRDYSGTDAGTIVASIGMKADNTMNFAAIEFRRKDSTELSTLEFSPKAAAAFGGTNTDFAGPDGSATLVRKRLPPGQYEIFRFASGANYGTSMVGYRAPENFAIPFTVKSGETVYLGQYLVGLNLQNGRPVSSYLMITDEYQRDTAKLGLTAASAKNEANTILTGASSTGRRLN